MQVLDKFQGSKLIIAHLVGVLEGPTVNAVVRGVERAFREPDGIAFLKATSANRLERSDPVKHRHRSLRPPSIATWADSHSVRAAVVIDARSDVRLGVCLQTRRDRLRRNVFVVFGHVRVERRAKTKREGEGRRVKSLPGPNPFEWRKIARHVANPARQ